VGIRQGMFFTKSLYSVVFGVNVRRSSDSLYSVEPVGSLGKGGEEGVGREWEGGEGGGERQDLRARHEVAVAPARLEDVPKTLEKRYENIERLGKLSKYDEVMKSWV